MGGAHGESVAAVRHLDVDVDAPQEERVAAVAHLSRYRGASREHTESDLRLFFNWCRERALAPLAAQRNDLELYARWMQEVRRLSRRRLVRRICSSRRC